MGQIASPGNCSVTEPRRRPRAHLESFIEEIEELACRWIARCGPALRERRGAERQRNTGAGPKRDLVFTDRALVTPLHLSTGFPSVARYGTARSTVSRAIGETRLLLAARGLAIHAPGVRLRGCTRPRRGRGESVYESTASRTRIAARRPTTQDDRPSCQARGNRTQSRPPPSMPDRLRWPAENRPGRMHDQPFAPGPRSPLAGEWLDRASLAAHRG